MFNSVQFVRDLCQKLSIPVARLEKDCGFSNGYLNPKKIQKLPYDRAVLIAQYLGVTADYILTGNKKATPVSIDKRGENGDLNLTKDEIAFICKFRCLDSRGKSAVLNILDHEYNSLPGDNTKASPKQA